MPLLNLPFLNPYFYSLTVIVSTKNWHSLEQQQYLANPTKHAISEDFHELGATLLASPRRLRRYFELLRSSIPAPYDQHHH